MSKVFKTIAKILGPILLMTPFALVGAALIIGSTALSVRDARKQKKAQQRALESLSSSQTLMIRQPIMPRRFVYGRARVGGMWVYVDTSSDNKYLYLVLALCQGPVKAIGDIYFNDQVVTLDGSGNGTGKWADKVRIKKHLGTTTQTVDTFLESDSTEWTSNHRLLGIAYISLRLQFDPGIFPNGLPNVSAVVTGKSDIVDGRDDSTGYTSNAALCLADYMTEANLGPNIDFDDELNHTDFDTAADTCDDQVTVESTGAVTTNYSSDANQLTLADHGLHDSQIVQFTTTGTLPIGLSTGTDYFVINSLKDSFEVTTALDDPASLVTLTSNGSGTHSFTAKEFKYTFNGVINTDNSPEENIKIFRDAMAGNVSYIGGKWVINAGEYFTPTLTIDESMLVGPIKFRPRVSKRERFNTVKGLFVTNQNRFQPADYPPITNSTYVTNDGEELTQGLDLPATNTPQAAQRIAKILLEKSRKERTLELVCNIEALKAQAGKTVIVNLPRYNINNQPFDVDAFNLEVSGGKVEITLGLSETAASVYSWTSGSDEQSFDMSDEPALSDGLPSAPTALTVTNTTTGREVVEAFMEWDATTDEYILQGGLVVVEWKKTADSTYQSITGSPASVEFPVKNLVPATSYDFRVAWRNKFGGQSEWAEETGHTTASSTSSAFAYTHTQSTPSTTWSITHDLGYQPGTVRVYNGSDQPVLHFAQKGTTTTITLEFNSAISGVAYFS